jgi:Gpi18-like mannosyltransferase
VHPSFSDENVYYLMGKNVAEGKIPYREFNFVHPPLQIYILALMFRLFGASLSVAKILPLISSSLSAFLVYLISKELYKEKTALLSLTLFILTPAFLAFSDQGYGMWESLFFVLLSTYFVIKNKSFFSAITYTVSIFFRYMALLYFPFLLILIYLRGKKINEFLLYFFPICFSFLLFSFILFGYNFIDQTILFHINTKVIETHLPKLQFQYLGMGFFTIFLGLISTCISLIRKDRLMLLLSVYPIFADLLVFFGLKTIAYHYFLFSVPFIAIVTSRSFMISKDFLIKVSLLLIIILSIIANFQTIEFYLNPVHSKNIYFITDYIRNNTSENDNIFGESSITDYISFTTDVPITSNYLDSYIAYLEYVNEERVIQNLEKQKPKFIIDMENYYMANPFFKAYIQEKYEFKMKVPGTPTYFIYERSKS